MNRRSFLKRVATGAVAAAALAHIPSAVLKAVASDSSRLWACEKLRARYNEMVKAGYQPVEFFVGDDFYELYEQELMPCQRFTSSSLQGETHLLFKYCPVRRVGQPGYAIGVRARM